MLERSTRCYGFNSRRRAIGDALDDFTALRRTDTHEGFNCSHGAYYIAVFGSIRPMSRFEKPFGSQLSLWRRSIVCRGFEISDDEARNERQFLFGSLSFTKVGRIQVFYQRPETFGIDARDFNARFDEVHNVFPLSNALPNRSARRDRVWASHLAPKPWQLRNRQLIGRRSNGSVVNNVGTIISVR